MGTNRKPFSIIMMTIVSIGLSGFFLFGLCGCKDSFFRRDAYIKNKQFRVNKDGVTSKRVEVTINQYNNGVLTGVVERDNDDFKKGQTIEIRFDEDEEEFRSEAKMNRDNIEKQYEQIVGNFRTVEYFSFDQADIPLVHAFRFYFPQR